MTLEQYLRIEPAWRGPLVVADGMGVDSTAMLVRLWQLGIVPDAIVHADTGDEHPETVAYRAVRSAWLASVGFPALTIVRRAPSGKGTRARRDGAVDVSYATLGDNCLANKTLPSLAFGRKACSVKWKIEPQNKWTKTWGPARRAWATGRRVVKLIGYDNGPKDSKRAHEMTGDHRYAYAYPLREWGWDRERCIAEIKAAGVLVPRKSACVMCPASKPHEIAELVRDYPAIADRICLIEDTARPGLRNVEGLWRKATRTRPGSMAVFIRGLRAEQAAPRRHLPVVAC